MTPFTSIFISFNIFMVWMINWMNVFFCYSASTFKFLNWQHKKLNVTLANASVYTKFKVSGVIWWYWWTLQNHVAADSVKWQASRTVDCCIHLPLKCACMCVCVCVFAYVYVSVNSKVAALCKQRRKTQQQSTALRLCRAALLFSSSITHSTHLNDP